MTLIIDLLIFISGLIIGILWLGTHDLANGPIVSFFFVFLQLAFFILIKVKKCHRVMVVLFPLFSFLTAAFLAFF
jgi:hypothetical protein